MLRSIFYLVTSNLHVVTNVDRRFLKICKQDSIGVFSCTLKILKISYASSP